VIAFEHLEERQIGIPGVLDIMRQSLQNVADIARFEIQSPSPAATRKYGHSSVPEM